jgi:WD40 repeat protein
VGEPAPLLFSGRLHRQLQVGCAATALWRRSRAPGSGDGTVRFWDLARADLLCDLSGHNREVTSLAYLEGDGVRPGLVVSAGWDKTVRVWDEEGRPLHVLPGHRDRINGLAIKRTADGAIVIASACKDGTVQLWDGLEGRRLRVINHPGAINIWGVAFSADARSVISGSDRTLRVWDVQTGELSARWEGHGGNVLCVALRAGLVASGDMDKKVRLWTDTGVPRRELSGHANIVVCVEISPDGRVVSSGSRDGVLILWDTATGAALHRLDQKQTVWMLSFAPCRPGGYWLASACEDGTTTLWVVAEGGGAIQLSKTVAEESPVTAACVAALQGGAVGVLAAGDKCAVRMWDATRGERSDMVLRWSRGPQYLTAAGGRGARAGWALGASLALIKPVPQAAA